MPMIFAERPVMALQSWSGEGRLNARVPQAAAGASPRARLRGPRKLENAPAQVFTNWRGRAGARSSRKHGAPRCRFSRTGVDRRRSSTGVRKMNETGQSFRGDARREEEASTLLDGHGRSSFPTTLCRLFMEGTKEWSNWHSGLRGRKRFCRRWRWTLRLKRGRWP
jgi:hypothetical protein